MRQRLLNYLLLLTLIVVGSGNVAWAESAATTVYERELSTWVTDDITATSGTSGLWYSTNFGIDATNGLTASGTGGRSAVLTFEHTANAIQTIDCVFNNLGNTGNTSNYSYLKLGSEIEIQSNQQNQNGTVIINGTSYSISNCNKKNINRGGDKWTIHAEINTATNQVTALTISGDTGGNNAASFTLSEAKALSGSASYNTVGLGTIRAGGSPAVGLISIKITEEAQSVQTADYTIKYVCGNSAVKTPVTQTGAVGNPISLGDADKASFTDEATGKKYIYVSDDAEGQTISAQGNTVVTIQFREAAIWNYAIKAIIGETELATLSQGTVSEGDAVNYGYPQYIAKDGTLYKSAKQSSNPWWGKSFTPTADNQSQSISYTGEGSENIVFCSEAEDINTLTPVTGGNTDIRASNRAGGYAASEAVITTLAPGKYKLFTALYGNAGTTFSFKAGGNEVLSLSTSGNPVHTESEEFTLTESSDITVIGGNAGDSPKVVDYIYIQKTGDVEIQPTTYEITATANPAEGGSVTGAGTYEEGAQVTLTATANNGYNFVNWTDATGEVSTEATYNFTATADVALTANFDAEPTVVADGVTMAYSGTTTTNMTGNNDATTYRCKRQQLHLSRPEQGWRFPHLQRQYHNCRVSHWCHNQQHCYNIH